MPMRHIEDRSGNPLPVYENDGEFLPPFLSEYLETESLQNYLNSDDYSPCEVLLCSYPRSGYHWFYENVNMLLDRSLSMTRTLGHETNLEYKCRRDGPQPRIVSTHLKPHLVPNALSHTKRIYIYRNPKDVAHSRYRMSMQYPTKYKGTFEDYAELFLDGKVLYGSWFEHTLEWETVCREQGILVVSYEEMTSSPVDALRRIAMYLEIQADDEFLKQITEACHIDNMKSKNLTPSIDVIRKGGVGNWKKYFTVALSEKFDRTFKEKMKHSSLKFTFCL